jgi:hypothetical protein
MEYVRAGIKFGSTKVQKLIYVTKPYLSLFLLLVNFQFL